MTKIAKRTKSGCFKEVHRLLALFNTDKTKLYNLGGAVSEYRIYKILGGTKRIELLDECLRTGVYDGKPF